MIPGKILKFNPVQNIVGVFFFYLFNIDLNR